MADDKKELVNEETPILSDKEEKEPELSLRWKFYLVYVLSALVIIYLMNQLDRYLITVLTTFMANDIHYGTQICAVNSTLDASLTSGIDCDAAASEVECGNLTVLGGITACSWIYSGAGFAYDVLIGPGFVVAFTLTGIFLGFAADVWHRKNLLMLTFVIFSVCTLLTGLVNAYWQLALLRFGLAIGEAGCTPLAASMIADYFPATFRATALGIYNWGIYIGYSMAFAFGTFITVADINGEGWRWAFYIAGMLGCALAILYFFTVNEPERLTTPGGDETDLKELLGDDVTWHKKLGAICKLFSNPALLVICLAGSVRNIAGYAWGGYATIFFESQGEAPSVVGTYLSWIPIVGGVTSVVLAGLLADKVIKKLGTRGRVMIVAASLIIAAPFALAVLCTDPPGAYYFLIPTYIFGEAWIGVTLAIVIELSPKALRTSAVAFYLFVISNIASLGPVLVTPLQNYFESKGDSTFDSLKYTMIILYPGCYVGGAILYLSSLFLLKPVDSAAVSSDGTPYEEIK